MFVLLIPYFLWATMPAGIIKPRKSRFVNGPEGMETEIVKLNKYNFAM
jgi:hypothetical protein